MEIQDGCQYGHQGHGKYRNGNNFITVFNSHSNVGLLLRVLACMFRPSNDKRGDVSMANDVCKSKMAAKVATTNMTIVLPSATTVHKLFSIREKNAVKLCILLLLLALCVT